MKIQITPNRIIKDAFSVWQEAGPGVDQTVDVKNLTFAENSIEKIYTFHVLDHLFPNEAAAALENWRKCLAPGGKLFIVVDDFEWLCRMFVGGSVLIDDFNEKFTHPTQFTTENLTAFCQKAGFDPNKIVIWYADVTDEFPKQEHELIFQVEKI